MHGKIVWHKYFYDELVILAQVVGNIVAGSNTIFFIPKPHTPQDRKVTYGIIVFHIKPQKSETHITRLTVGGNIIDHPGEVTNPTAYTTTVKTQINSTISTHDIRFMCE